MYFRPQHLIIFRCFLESKKRVAVLAEPVKIPDHQDPISSTTRFRSNVFLLTYTGKKKAGPIKLTKDIE